MGLDFLLQINSVSFSESDSLELEIGLEEIGLKKRKIKRKLIWKKRELRLEKSF